jgi:PAS domain S-box-containing protein
MQTQFLFKKPADSPWLRNYPRYAGALVALFGVWIIISWYEHWQRVLQVMPDTPPMHFNTAGCFILTGTALFLLTFPRQKLAPWMAGAAMLLTALTLLEYLTGKDLNIDELFYKHYFEVARIHPGRMSLLASICFLFCDTGIILLSWKRVWPQRLTMTGMLACIVVAVSAMSLFGFIFKIESSYGWGAYSSMPINSAACFVVLGSGLLAWAWQTARGESFNFLRWLPITASVTLITMVGFVSAMNMNELNTATFWRQHTFQVTLETQSFNDNLMEMQRGLRGYVSTDDTNSRATYQNDRKLEADQFNKLVELTSDNPTQIKQLKNVAATIDDFFGDADKQIALYDQQGFPAGTRFDPTGENRRLFNRARDNLRTFRQTEQDLLQKRDDIEQADYRNTARLLVLGSGLAAVLLLLANRMASRELFQRKKVEQQLRETTTLQNAIFNSAKYAIISLDSKGVVRTFNPAAEQMLGYAAHEVIGKVTPMLWRDKTEVATEAKRLSDELGYAVKPGIEVITSRSFPSQGHEYETTYIHKSGRRFPVLVSLTPLTDDSGALTGFLGVVADITERRRAAEKIRESEERFRSALDNAPIGMSLVSPEGRWLKVNQALLNILGYSEAELLATDFQHITHPHDLENDLELVRQVLAGTIASYQMEKRYLHKDGNLVSVMLNVSLVRDQHQQPLYFVSQVENITERKQREAEREKLISDLQQALTEVKTLSGMIPICGWCKSVRSDEGYWQTVEQYVHAHSHATFSHGMCPSCTEKFKKEIKNANDAEGPGTR